MEENCILPVDSKPINKTWRSCFGSSDSGSALSSPLGSELGSSTGTESDEEDDYIAELTRRMAHNTLQDDEDRHEKTTSVAGSPQSTLLSGFSSGDEDVLHMPVTEEGEKNRRVKTSEELENSEKLLSSPVKPISVPLIARKPNSPSVEFQSRQALIDDQIRVFHLYKLQAEPGVMKQESLSWGKQADSYKQAEAKQQVMQFQSKSTKKGTKKVSWANFAEQHRSGSEMRAIFLGDQSGSKRVSSGTGVFLPRGISKTSELPKKSGSSTTVLLPERVVQALRLHYDKVGGASRSGSNGAGFPLQHDALMSGAGDVTHSVQLQQKSQERTAEPGMDRHHELSLPPEWTY